MIVDINEKDGAVIFAVRVIPRASQSEVVGVYDRALKVRVASPPVDGAANTELTKLLAKKFGVTRGDVEIIGGQTSKSKRIKISNLSQSKFEEMIK